ncbi:MAG: archaemetzincin family Zn-dependent metalloprotease [Melioribacteraceae bacterium]|nr:archaemetzincin family Zn-dependent metalloprotease [Melioribacteraceae bacterium]
MRNLIISHVNFEYSKLLDEINNEISELTRSVLKIEQIDKNFDEFFNSERGQYDASKIIKSLQKKDDSKTIIFTSVDIYIPIFTYVFGLAKLNGCTGVISSQRLSNNYYGIPENPDILKRRLVVETVHEFGHLMGLRHCENVSCVMASSTAVDELDVKNTDYCKKCSSIFINY